MREKDYNQINSLIKRRNDLIRQLWIVYTNLSDVLESDEFEKEDAELWFKITKHKAIQNRLGGR